MFAMSTWACTEVLQVCMHSKASLGTRRGSEAPMSSCERHGQVGCHATCDASVSFGSSYLWYLEDQSQQVALLAEQCRPCAVSALFGRHVVLGAPGEKERL